MPVPVPVPVRSGQPRHASARPTEIDDTSYDRAATTAADEEDLFLKGAPEAESAESEGDEYGDFEEEPASDTGIPPIPEKE